MLSGWSTGSLLCAFIIQPVDNACSLLKTPSLSLHFGTGFRKTLHQAGLRGIY